MRTIGHHTCRKDNGPDYVVRESPFKAQTIYRKLPDGTENEDDAVVQPFLGEGYYLWDYNLDMAKHWGKTHYGNDYFVLEFEVNVDDDYLLDLVGSRQNIEHLIELIGFLKREKVLKPEWRLGKTIDVIRKFHKIRGNDIFPYKATKAIDHSAGFSFFAKQFNYQFVEGKRNFMNMNPRLIICVYEKDNVILRGAKIVHPIL